MCWHYACFLRMRKTGLTMRGSYTCLDSADSAKSLMVVGAHVVFVRDRWALSCEVKSWSCGKGVLSFFLTGFQESQGPNLIWTQTFYVLDPDRVHLNFRCTQQDDTCCIFNQQRERWPVKCIQPS